MNRITTLLLAAFFGISGLVQAQCVPDTTITDLIVPPAGTQVKIVGNDTIAILPYAQVKVPYNESMYFMVPEDTTYLGIPATVDSVGLLEILNLPNTLTVTCSQPNCMFPGDSYGCLSMTGTPTVPDSIELKLVVKFNVTVVFAGQPTPYSIIDTLDDNFFLVIKPNPIGLSKTKMAQNKAEVFPNPASDIAMIRCHGFSGPVSLQVMNVIGNVVEKREIVLENGENNIPLKVNGYKPGIYIYSISTKNHTYSGRFTVNR